MKTVEEITKPFKSIDNFPEYFDAVTDTLDHIVDQFKKEGYTRDPNEHEPQYWDFAITTEGMKVYESVRSELYKIAIDKFEKDEIYDFPDVIEYA